MTNCACICVTQKARCEGHKKAGVNFINILHTNFLYECHFSSFFYVHVTREKLTKQRSNKKFVGKMLMKLTKGRTSMTSFSDNELMSLPFSTEIWISFFLRSNFLMTFFCRHSNVRFKTAIEKWLSCHNAIGVSQSQQYYFQRKPLNVINFMYRGQFCKCSKNMSLDSCHESLWNHTFIKTIL